ncbi:tRNA glutamyl-Q(34) synthetase GluQRS [Thalassotalea sp. 42_200_T64]|nr:tRNA glutamyl-Q(34) synthetase GluQRS [Thalassotalea sp. 42_200_T64]
MHSIKHPLSQRPHSTYRGRFAPSPSGLLHFGSLAAAIASFLQAKSNAGLWLVRIEDIDKPREMPGSDKAILNTLEAYGMHWDEQVLYQSEQAELYRDVLNYLQESKQSYFCRCTRSQIKKSGGIYPGTCKFLHLDKNDAAIRLINKFPYREFMDGLQGHVHFDHALAQEDFIIHRRDGLFAYQLAVVVDDIYQGISEVVRGCDLLEPTSRQLSLFKTLNRQAPAYVHIPLAVTDEGYKLSKQNAAPPIDDLNPQPGLIQALHFLGQKPPRELQFETVDSIITWAIKHWQLSNVPKKTEIHL